MAELEHGIETFVEQVLAHRFPGETFKQGIKKTAQGIRFHCPYCGDTYTLGANPRGNLYLKSGRYKCFNGGCNASVSLRSFVSKWANEYDIPIDGIDLTAVNMDETSNHVYNNLLVTKDNTICDYLSDLEIYDKLPKLDMVKYVYGLIDINTLSIDSKVRKYLESRFAYDIPNVNKRIYADCTDNKIYMLNVDDKEERVLSYATRRIDFKKYMIYTYSDLANTFNIEIKDEDREFLDMISSYFNILNVDFRRMVNIAEGQFDSMFLDNYMAIQGVSKGSFILNHIDSDNITLYFDDDKAGNTTTRDMVEEAGYGFFNWNEMNESLSKLTTIKVHDINELYCSIKKTLGNKFDVKTFWEILSRHVKKFDRSTLSFNLF